MVRAKIPQQLVSDHTTLKKSYGCDLVIKDRRNVFFILDEILEGEFEEMWLRLNLNHYHNFDVTLIIKIK